MLLRVLRIRDSEKTTILAVTGESVNLNLNAKFL